MLWPQVQTLSPRTQVQTLSPSQQWWPYQLLLQDVGSRGLYQGHSPIVDFRSPLWKQWPTFSLLVPTVDDSISDILLQFYMKQKIISFTLLPSWCLTNHRQQHCMVSLPWCDLLLLYHLILFSSSLSVPSWFSGNIHSLGFLSKLLFSRLKTLS